MIIRHFYWRGKKNFGDALGPLLLRHFSDLETEWSPLKDAAYITVGSILDNLPVGWSGAVVGSGKLHEASTPDLTQATVFGLRGPLTARTVQLAGKRRDFCLGDPGLLADELVPIQDKEYTLGLVPHWSDEGLEKRPEFQKFNPLIIRPSEDPLEVIAKIGKCRKIVASSLHGLIVADAFGIPRRTEMTPRFAKEGGDFKFRDHCAAIGMEFKVGVTQEAPRARVQDRKHEVYDMLREVGRIVMGLGQDSAGART